MVEAASFTADVEPSPSSCAPAGDGATTHAPRRVTELTRDSGCCRSLNWRCDLQPGIDAQRLEAVFVDLGYTSRCRHPSLKVFRHPEGHELAWVVTTGRVQLRVAMIVEEELRASTARQLYQDMIALLQRLDSES